MQRLPSLKKFIQEFSNLLVKKLLRISTFLKYTYYNKR